MAFDDLPLDRSGSSGPPPLYEPPEPEPRSQLRWAVVALAGSGAYLIALDRDFNQLLNTRVPFGETLGPTSNPRAATEALERVS